MRLWNLTDDLGKQLSTSSMLLQALCIILWPSVNSNFSYSPKKTNSGQHRRFYVPCDLETWWMTLKNNTRAPLLCYFKLCASFHSHWGIKTGVTRRRHYLNQWWLVYWCMYASLSLNELNSACTVRIMDITMMSCHMNIMVSKINCNSTVCSKSC